eukprot:1843791-Rhodomonas_salina.1
MSRAANSPQPLPLSPVCITLQASGRFSLIRASSELRLWTTNLRIFRSTPPPAASRSARTSESAHKQAASAPLTPRDSKRQPDRYDQEQRASDAALRVSAVHSGQAQARARARARATAGVRAKRDRRVALPGAVLGSDLVRLAEVQVRKREPAHGRAAHKQLR